MSGHSKWATTKRQKAVVDAKRSSLFTKLAKNIAVAARDGADPKMNFKLRMAIDQARAMSMPKDNIERAVARGSGGGDAGRLETALYEGYGPGGVAVMIEVITDNKNRAASEVRRVFSKYNGKFGASVAWMFDLRGVLTLDRAALTQDTELALIDLGMIDLQQDQDTARVIVPLEQLQHIKENMEKLGLAAAEAGSEYVAKETTRPTDAGTVVKFLDELDDLDDVNSVFSNAEL